jgi:hypothetical protein
MHDLPDRIRPDLPENDVSLQGSTECRLHMNDKLRLKPLFGHAFSQTQPLDSEVIYATKKGGS